MITEYERNIYINEFKTNYYGIFVDAIETMYGIDDFFCCVVSNTAIALVPTKVGERKMDKHIHTESQYSAAYIPSYKDKQKFSICFRNF